MSLFGTNSLQAPTRIKVDDPNLQRQIDSLYNAVIELQNLLRAAIAAIIKLGGTV